MVRRLAVAFVLLVSTTRAEESKGGVGGFGDFSFTSKKDPIQVTSDKLDFDYKNRRTVFRGNVQLVQGEMHLNCDTFTVDYEQQGDRQTLKAANADGNVTITQGAKKAAGDHATFDQNARTLILSGHPSLEDGLNQVKGDKITVYPDESRMEVSGDNSRVKVILFPGQGSLDKNGAAATPPAETSKAAGGGGPAAASPAPSPAAASTAPAATGGDGGR